MTAADVSVVIVNWNGKHYLDACLGSLTGIPSVVVVDNGSTDGSEEFVRGRFPAVQFIALGRNVGFSAANNVGARACAGQYLLFLNNDTVVGTGAVQRMRAAFDRDPAIGIVGARLELTDGTPQFGSIGTPPSFRRELKRIFRLRPADATRDDPFDYSRSQYCVVVCGAALMIRRDIFDRLGGWPEEYFAYGEDADLCRSALATGYKIWYESEARVTHFHGGSGKHRGMWLALRAQFIGHRSLNQYIRRHEGIGLALVHGCLFGVGVLTTGLRAATRRILK